MPKCEILTNPEIEEKPPIRKSRAFVSDRWLQIGNGPWSQFPRAASTVTVLKTQVVYQLLKIYFSGNKYAVQ